MSHDWLQWTRTPPPALKLLFYYFLLPITPWDLFEDTVGPKDSSSWTTQPSVISNSGFVTLRIQMFQDCHSPWVSVWDGQFSSLEFGFCLFACCLSLGFFESIVLHECWPHPSAHAGLPINPVLLFSSPLPSSSGPLPGHLASWHILSSKCVYCETKWDFWNSKDKIDMLLWCLSWGCLLWYRASRLCLWCKHDYWLLAWLVSDLHFYLKEQSILHITQRTSGQPHWCLGIALVKWVHSLIFHL